MLPSPVDRGADERRATFVGEWADWKERRFIVADRGIHHALRSPRKTEEGRQPWN